MMVATTHTAVMGGGGGAERDPAARATRVACFPASPLRLKVGYWTLSRSPQVGVVCKQERGWIRRPL